MQANINIQDGLAQMAKRMDDSVEAKQRTRFNTPDSSQPAQSPPSQTSPSPDGHNGQNHYSPMGQSSPPSQAYPTTDPYRNYHTTYPPPFMVGFPFAPSGNVYNNVGGNQTNSVNHFNGSGGINNFGNISGNGNNFGTNNFGNISGNNNNFGTITGGASYGR